MSVRTVNGVLLVYYQPLSTVAPILREHVDAFARYSRFAVWPVNSASGLPRALRSLRFKTIVLHFSLFGPPPLLGSWPDGLSAGWRSWLSNEKESYKVAFFQDEHHFCPERFVFLDECGVDCIFTLLDEGYWDQVYRRHSRVSRLVHTLTGYVSEDLVASAERLFRPDASRRVDVGYRARRLPFYMGRGGQEKADIAAGFLARVPPGLVADVTVDEDRRLYGDAWWRFLADCRGVLGVEAGVSIFDLDGRARQECGELVQANPSISFEEAHARVLHAYDGQVRYRTISPRHFEAAAFRVCQILFEGDYQGILQPDVHYLPLKKDFSNFDEVMGAFRDPARRKQLTDRAYEDLIASGRWSYRQFVEDFDRELTRTGASTALDNSERLAVTRMLNGGAWLRQLRNRGTAIRHLPFPGRRRLRDAVHRLFRT